ncbi:reverse transcriptase-like protein [Bacillus sp. REN10]|uniref:reverse transcriptase-like protein n=1 Tax=Bacillus sp. REN10 TaxID=2782541 RepID=UPI00193AE9EB|nr:reverse transcriptase-like protein [Bacillus sp. REN10]
MKMKIKWQYEYKGRKAEFESEWLMKEQVLPIIEDLQKGGRMKSVVVVDELWNEWTVKEFKKLDQQLEEEPGEVKVYFDGGYDRRSRVASIGIVIYYKKNGQEWRLRRNDRLMQLDSNNEAEYAALFRAAVALEELGVHHVPVIIRGDSQVVLKQLSGEWPCFEESFNHWLDRIEQKIHALGIEPLYEPIDRKQNKEADKLANQALQQVFVDSHALVEE